MHENTVRGFFWLGYSETACCKKDIEGWLYLDLGMSGCVDQYPSDETLVDTSGIGARPSQLPPAGA